MTWKHDFCLWLGKSMYGLGLIDWNTFHTQACRIVADKYNMKIGVVDEER
jgi:alpha-D-ribose 1-methylphosphonate 5-triphosphate synthase subunit PhnH